MAVCRLNPGTTRARSALLPQMLVMDGVAASGALFLMPRPNQRLSTMKTADNSVSVRYPPREYLYMSSSSGWRRTIM